MVMRNSIGRLRWMSTIQNTFNELKLNKSLCAALDEMKVFTPSEIQNSVIPRALDGQNILCSAPTGTGKTLAYLLPTVQQLALEEEKGCAIRKAARPRSIILVPSRELGEQVASVARKLAHHQKFVTGVLTSHRPKRYQAPILDGITDVLIATPDRLLKHVVAKEVFLSSVQHFIIDEVDTMYEARSGFRTPMEELWKQVMAGAAYRNGDVQVVMAAATMKPLMEKMLIKKFNDVRVVKRGDLHQTPKSIEQHFVRVAGQEGKFVALRKLLQTFDLKNRQVIVFCNHANGCCATEHMLREHEYSSTHFHGDIQKDVRRKNFDSFVAGTHRILVATDLAARGLDLTSVYHVINFDLPSSAVDYLHRSGRTGRAGAPGVVHSLVTKSDRRLVEDLTQKKDKLTEFAGKSNSKSHLGKAPLRRRVRQRS